MVCFLGVTDPSRARRADDGHWMRLPTTLFGFPSRLELPRSLHKRQFSANIDVEYSFKWKNLGKECVEFQVDRLHGEFVVSSDTCSGLRGQGNHKATPGARWQHKLVFYHVFNFRGCLLGYQYGLCCCYASTVRLAARLGVRNLHARQSLRVILASSNFVD
jgi:hypothetical protein